MEEFVEIEDNSLKPREIYKARKNDSINIDYFLYACWEQEKTRKGLEDTDNPYFSDFMKQTTSYDDADYEKGIDSIIKSYKSEYPVLSESGQVTISTVIEFIPGFIGILFEVFELGKKKFLAEIPPLRNGESDSKDNFWQPIDKKLAEHFPNHQEIMLKYLSWAYSKAEKEVLDLTSVPPSGEYTRKHLRAKDKAEYQKRNKSRDDRKKSSVKRDFDKNKKRGPRKDDKGSDKEREKEVIQEANDAMKKLKSDNGTDGHIVLKPQNSFLRRIQHKHIGDTAGFKSESVGEGKDRAIKVIRS